MRSVCLLLTMLVAGALAGCSADPSPVPPAPTRVGIATVSDGPARPPVLATGVLATRDEFRLSFKVGGIIREITVEAGDSVRQGQLLASLEPAEIDAGLAEAREFANKAQRDLERGRRLQADEVISREELEGLETQAAVAAARLRAAEFNRQFATIVAPRNGVVLRRLADARELVPAGQPVLVLGPEAAGYVVRAGLADRDVIALRRGDPATVTLDAYPGETFPGNVTVLPGAADDATGLFEIEVELAATPARLVSGMVARLSLMPSVLGTALLPHVPVAAVIEADRDRAVVYVIDNGKAVRRPVQVAFIAPDTVAVASGVSTGEQVVTEGALYLEDGEAVQAGDVGNGKAGK